MCDKIRLFVSRPMAFLLWALTVGIFSASLAAADPADSPGEMRLGIIGLDTSHSPAIVKTFNEPNPQNKIFNGFRVVAAYPLGSQTIESSASRIPEYTAKVEAQGVEIVDSVEELLAKVDGVLLETNDGQLHLQQALKVFRAGKPVFIDKPVGSNLAETIAIFRAAEHYGVPMFSSSSLRYTQGAQAIRNGKIGKVLGATAYSPCKLEPSHVDLFWYGIHGVESLFTCMGVGCQSVSHTSTADCELAVGVWNDGRIGTFRGMRSGSYGSSAYGGNVFGAKSIAEIGPYDGYEPLFAQIAKFFVNGNPPIDSNETIEIYAFMQAASASKQAGGGPIAIADVLGKATEEADSLLQGELHGEPHRNLGGTDR